jgi:hypothetical protein
MTIPVEKIMAYVDGELDADSRAEVEAAAAADPDVAAALSRHEALRRRVADAHADVLHEPPPAELEALIRGANLRQGPPEVVELSARRAQRSRPTLTRAQPWALLAAGFAAGLLVMTVFANRSPALYTTHGRQLTAQGQLARALDHDLASDPAASAGPVRVGLSFKARDGRYCRTFNAAPALAGVACREGPAWNIRTAVFTQSKPAETPYRTAAATTPAPVLSAVQDMIDGAPLDAGAEKGAQARGWR